MARYDRVVLNGTVVLPGLGPARMDVGIKDGRIAAIADALAPAEASDVIDATNRVVLPGAVDSHFHIGIYRPFSDDALSESTSAVSGGVTTLISYFRTGSHYLGKSGPYREIFPEVLKLSADRFRCDYSYHIAPMTNEHLDEMAWLVDQGVGSFKLYMFYKSLTLSSDSTKGREYTMADEYRPRVPLRDHGARRAPLEDARPAHLPEPALREPRTDARVHRADAGPRTDGA